MSSADRVTFEGGFEMVVPPGWSHERDEEGGVLMAAADGPGLLHILPFEQGDEDLDPAEELFAFLDGQGVELEEDEVEDIELDGAAELAYCEYLTEDEEDESEDEAATYWLVGVATGPGRLVFCSYSCPAGSQDVERETVLDSLRTIRLRPPGG